MQKILVTGSNSRFGNVLKKIKTNKKFFFRDKNQLNILSIQSIEKNIKKFKPNYILHLAGLSRPMSLHEKEISNSINLNIVGTCNLVKIAAKYNLKLIYFSTNYIYQGTKGNYKETDPVKPWNNYGWSKLGGECAVQMYKNSLILRMCMAEKPFVHDRVYANVKSNFIFQEDAAQLMLKVLNKKGVINIGGPSNLIYNFAKKNKKNIKKIFSKGEFPKRMDMSLKKLKRMINK
jgi:dTDP-4-dehydrorhamnose reductase|tara:strand:+ start:910 stop:1608 length:699 start_codon:yes stop_codon:yes gene_type:complete